MRRNRRHSQGSHDRWLVSYADFITLLFAFFVVLYASSKADQKKQQQVAQSIDSAFRTLGVFQDASLLSQKKALSASSKDQPVLPINIIMGEEVMAPAAVKKDLETIRRQMEKLLSNQIAQHTVSIHMGRDGLVISLREAGFFRSGSAAPDPAGLPVLRLIAARVAETPYELSIEGHTDNVPIHNWEFDSNWELSSSRATRIARLFLASSNIAPKRISAAGYAEYHPVAGNTTIAGRAENRRVDLILRPHTLVNLAASNADDQRSHWKKITD